jgi:prophage tail gpP-like protein
MEAKKKRKAKVEDKANTRFRMRLVTPEDISDSAQGSGIKCQACEETGGGIQAEGRE